MDRRLAVQALAMLVVLLGCGYAAYHAIPTVIPALLTWVTTPAPEPGVLGEGAFFAELMIPAFLDWAPRAFPGLVIGGLAAWFFAFLASNSE